MHIYGTKRLTSMHGFHEKLSSRPKMKPHLQVLETQWWSVWSVGTRLVK